MDEKKIALDKAAYEIFLKNGYKNTNIAEISKKAGISVGAFYKYYDSKEDIFVDIYIRENESMRSKLLNKMNWKLQPLEVMTELFQYIEKNMLNNKILAEWNNPKLNDKLRNYYLSEEGIRNNSFHQFILSYIKKYLVELGYQEDEIAKIIRVYEMTYFIDCNVTEEEFAGKNETLKVMLNYFIQGVLQDKS